jgi:hypothetical protein
MVSTYGEPRCVICGRKPDEISEYVLQAMIDEGCNNALDFVMKEEGTYNSIENCFCCTDCYVLIGCPSGIATKKWEKLKPKFRNKKHR